jgi:biofilm PGA synthesis N-glycosyltransferase PgaC
MWVLPNYALAVVLPLFFLPLTTVMAILMVHEQGWRPLALYTALFITVHVAVAAIAVQVMGQSRGHLLMVPVYRLVFEPLRAYLIYSAAFMALSGVSALWNKLPRSGSLDADVSEPAPAVIDLRGPASVEAAPVEADLREAAPAEADLREAAPAEADLREAAPAELDLRDLVRTPTAATVGASPGTLPTQRSDRADDGLSS